MSAANVQVPVLLYHYVGECPPEDFNDTYRAGLWVSEQRFAEQLRELATAGYRSVSLSEVGDYFARSTPLHAKPVVLTFDDGQEDNYTRAFPLLRSYGMRATFFINSDMADKPGFMSWDQLREMSDAGMAIEAHTARHADLTKISRAELTDQLGRCRTIIEKQIKRDVRVLAYPGGHYNAAVVNAVREAGYRLAVTTLDGLTIRQSAQYEVPRTRVTSEDSIATLECKMRDGDGWQYVAKRALRRRGLWRSWKKLRKRARHTFSVRQRMGCTSE